MDNDTLVLQDAAQAVLAIDIQYKLASFNDQQKLKGERDKAFNAYSNARLKLLQQGVICTEADVKEMNKIRQEIEQAAQTQSLIAGIFSLVKFLVAL